MLRMLMHAVTAYVQKLQSALVTVINQTVLFV